MLCTFPILWVTVFVGVRCDHLSHEFHSFDIEMVLVGECTEPDVFRVVFPVCLCTAPLFPFPGDAAADFEILFGYLLNCPRRSPVSTDIHRRCTLQAWNKLAEPRINPMSVLGAAHFSEHIGIECLAQVVGGGQQTIDLQSEQAESRER